MGITPRSTNRLLADLKAIGVPIVSTPYGFRVRHHIGEAGERKSPETPISVPLALPSAPPSPAAQVEEPADQVEWVSELVKHGIIEPEQAEQFLESDPWEE